MAQVSALDPAVAIVQGLAGIPGLIAAQVEAVTSTGAPGSGIAVGEQFAIIAEIRRR